MQTEVRWCHEGRPQFGSTDTYTTPTFALDLSLLDCTSHVLGSFPDWFVVYPFKIWLFKNFAYLNIRSLNFRIWELHEKYAKICTIRKFPAIRYLKLKQLWEQDMHNRTSSSVVLWALAQSFSSPQALTLRALKSLFFQKVDFKWVRSIVLQLIGMPPTVHTYLSRLWGRPEKKKPCK